MEYAAQVKQKLDDPATPREEYMRCWEEWQRLQQEQGRYDEQIKKLMEKRQ